MSDTTLAEKSKERVVTDPVKDAKARELLITSRVRLLLHSPFFGNLATRLTLVNADDWCLRRQQTVVDFTITQNLFSH